jgi:enediyne biosynthesis protein E7
MATPPPGPKGEQLGRINYEFCQTDIFGFLKALSEQYGDVVGFDLGGLPYIFVNGARQVHELFSQREASLRKPEFIKDSNRGHWGDGLTSLEGSAWQSRRRILGSCFGPGFMRRFLPIVAQCTEAMLESWASGSGADLIEDLRILTARIAIKTVLDAELEGHEAASDRSAVIPFAEAYGEAYVGVRGGDPIAPLVVVRPRAPRRMDTTIRIIDQRIASGEDKGDVLSQLIRAGLRDDGGLTREEIIGEVMQILYAGHHTIPTSLINFWRDVAEGEMSARIAAEADHLCAAGVPNSARISDSYCLAAFKESMRLHPAAPILYREVENEFGLNGFEFSRDAAVWVSPQLLHNSPNNFPEPHRFIAERFLHRKPIGPGQLPYFPFGAGQRACIANHLALHQMVLIALLSARHFTLHTDQDGRHTFRARLVGQL